MSTEEIQVAIKRAIEDLKKEDRPLDFSVVHERSTAHRLAVHLERNITGWDVDCEYDRDEDMRKRLDGITGCDEQKKNNVIFPDIIVHRRNRSGGDNNLLVVEMKKDKKRDDCDAKKLELLTEKSGNYQYQLGLYINITEGRFDCTWYKNGTEYAKGD